MYTRLLFHSYLNTGITVRALVFALIGVKRLNRTRVSTIWDKNKVFLRFSLIKSAKCTSWRQELLVNVESRVTEYFNNDTHSGTFWSLLYYDVLHVNWCTPFLRRQAVFYYFINILLVVKLINLPRLFLLWTSCYVGYSVTFTKLK